LLFGLLQISGALVSELTPPSSGSKGSRINVLRLKAPNGTKYEYLQGPWLPTKNRPIPPRRKKSKPVSQKSPTAQGTYTEAALAKRRLSLKKQTQKRMEVFMDEPVHQGIQALAALEGTDAQKYAESVLAREVANNKERIPEALEVLRQTDWNIPKAALILKNEEITRLKRQLVASQSDSSPSR